VRRQNRREGRGGESTEQNLKKNFIRNMRHNCKVKSKAIPVTGRGGL
jgi:hypothetical protein